MIHDAPTRWANGRPESLRWQPTRGRREKRLRDAFRAGRQIDLTLTGRAGPDGRPGSRRQVVRAKTVAAILCGDFGPRNIVRLTLRGARITGTLNLSYARIDHPIALRDCVFDQPIVLAEARLGALTLDGCRFPGMDARNLEVDGDLGLRRVHSSRMVRLTGAHLHRDLLLTGAQLNCGADEDAALAADHVVVDGSVAGARLNATDTVVMANAWVNGTVRLDDATVADSGRRNVAVAGDDRRRVAFDGDGMTVGHDFSACRLAAAGEVTLVDASIASALELQGAELANPGEVALRLDRAEISSSLYCNSGFKVTGSMDAIGAHVKGSVYLNQAELGRPGPAGSAAASAPAEAALCLVRTRIDGDLSCWKDFVAHGPIDLRRSSVGGQFSLLTTGLEGTADLAHARFATLKLMGEPLAGFLDLTKAKADFFDDLPTVRWPEGDIILDEFEYDTIQQYDTIQRTVVPVKERVEWLRRAMGASRRRSGGAHDGYLPQPYDQLAAAYRRAGDDHSARRIQLAKYKQRDKVTGWGRWYSKLWNIVQDVAIGYGYEPWRALVSLAVLFVLGVSLFRYVGFFRPYPVATVAHHHPLSFTLNNSVSYTLDLLLPTSALDTRQVWQSSGPGEVAASILVALGLLLTATIFAAAARVLQRN